MLRVVSVILFAFVTTLCNGLATADDRQAKQAELDAACEAARQTALAPKKAKAYQECIDILKKSVEVCEQEAEAYNGNRVGRPPLFYDLPACEAAFEYRKNK
ncbi:MAG TPA: hypothetical protein DCO71_11530 [Gammaproteobacteria bacterium]|nr:hypothetical protein [Gammaproteobacteria bacterium]